MEYPSHVHLSHIRRPRTILPDQGHEKITHTCEAGHERTPPHGRNNASFVPPLVTPKRILSCSNTSTDTDGECHSATTSPPRNQPTDQLTRSSTTVSSPSLISPQHPRPHLIRIPAPALLDPTDTLKRETRHHQQPPQVPFPHHRDTTTKNRSSSLPLAPLKTHTRTLRS